MIFSLPKTESDVYPFNRKIAFTAICDALHKDISFSNEWACLVAGDSLKKIRNVPDKSVDLIVTDPPYHSSKKKNIKGDTDFETDEDYLNWMNEYFVEFHRVLKPNGALYLFCSSAMAPFLYVQLSKTFNMHNLIAWSKPNEPGYDGWKQKMNKKALRTWYPHSERIIFASPAYEGNLKKTLFGQFLKECRKICKLSSKELTEAIGEYGKVNNGGAVSNWETGRNIPSRAQWAKISQALIGTKFISALPAYEDVIRPFNIDPSNPFVDVWDHTNVRQYKGKHPAEKPSDLLRLIIETSSYTDDVVMDCFMGSGATIAAARSLGRRAIGIELDSHWLHYAATRVESTSSDSLSKLKQTVCSEDEYGYEGLPLLSTSKHTISI